MFKALNKILNKDGIFSFLLVLTGFFILLEISFFIQCSRLYLMDFMVVSDRLAMPFNIVPGLLYFLSAQLAIHLVFTVFICVVALSIANLYEMSTASTLRLSVFTWCFGIITILAANLYYYPNSAFSDLMTIIVPSRQMDVAILILSLLAWSIMLTLALISILAAVNKKHLAMSVAGIAMVAAIFFKWSISATHSGNMSSATIDRPNIILIGMDSMRPDFIGFFGHDKPTPFIDSFLERSTVFAEAITPLARTFPSWTGILSGLYPKESGVRFNLARQDKLDLSTTLSALLKRNGYETVYATDETRFSNIDTNFGFDNIVSPPSGLNDFLIGTFNDFPLSNLVLNTVLGKWLFPYSYGNRPVAATYEPDSFLSLLRPVVSAPHAKPLFLAVHFCLAHFPYHWANLSVRNISVQQRYEASVQRVDQQVADFYAMLEHSGLLNNAIVVMLSDHGEALELSGDRITEKNLFVSANKKDKSLPHFYSPGLDTEAVNKSAGHGTDVLGLPQYHSLLAFRLYGREQTQERVVPGIVSLLDIKPTILDLVHLPAPKSSGITLAAYVREKQPAALQPTHIFLESDFSPEAIRTVYPDMRQVMLEGVELFQLDPSSTRLIVKNSMGKMIISSKQYADIYGDWMLALYPQGQSYRMPILVNLATGLWTNDLQSSLARHSPAIKMLDKLKAFYGDEISKVSSVPAQPV